MQTDETSEGGGPHRTVHGLRLHQAVYVTVSRASGDNRGGARETLMAVGGFDRRNSLYMTNNVIDYDFVTELRAVRSFLLSDWSELHTLAPHLRDMVREMMARARYYQMLGFQFEPENLREVDPTTTH